jgi:hypothetical protein
MKARDSENDNDEANSATIIDSLKNRIRSGTACVRHLELDDGKMVHLKRACSPRCAKCSERRGALHIEAGAGSHVGLSRQDGFDSRIAPSRRGVRTTIGDVAFWPIPTFSGAAEFGRCSCIAGL